MARAWLALGLVGAACLVVLVGAWRGWFGPLLACGPEQATLCVAWPTLAAAATWLGYLSFFVALGVWHLLEWRREPLPPASSDDGSSA